MSGIVGSRLNIRGSGLVGSLGTDGQHLLSSGAGVTNAFESVSAGGDLSFGGDTFGADKTIGANDTYALSFETDGNVAMKIDSGGRITKPLQPCFAVYLSTNVTPGSSAATVVWGGETLDVGSNFASNTFTAPVDGNYLFNVRVFAEGLGSEYFKIAIIPSGSQYNHITTADNESYEPMEYSEIIPLSASDTVTITTYANNTTYFLQGTSGSSYHYCTFSGCLLT
jgi:hypothetical protein